MQQPGEARHWPAHAECKGDQPHVLDRRKSEQTLDVLLPREVERGYGHRQEPEAHHQIAGEVALQRAVDEYLAAYHRV
jgi:hypothetical protein